MREIVFDTETTGLSAEEDRVIEIGCVEIIDLVPTGKNFHVYINPTHPVSKGAFNIHGLSNEFLKTKPTFTRVVNRFLRFIGDSQLVAHNATFDIRMINAELRRQNLPELENPVVDTLKLSRERRPGGKHTLDALCSFYGIDNSRRKKHGALLDSEILAEVYVELCGGRQMSLAIPEQQESTDKVIFPPARQRPNPLVRRMTAEEIAAHKAFVDALGDKAIWKQYEAEQAT